MEFSNACTDVEFIIQNMEEEDRSKIPEEIIETISFFKSEDYQTKINIFDSLEEQELSTATKGLIAYLYNNYLGTEEEKQQYKSDYKNYIKNTNTDIFKKESHHINLQKALVLQEDKKSFLSTILEKIRSIFK